MAYFNQCLPKVMNMRDGSGCSFTRASFSVMTPDQFAALGDQEDLQRVYANAAEAGMRGVVQRPISSILMGRLKDFSKRVSQINIGQPKSILAPYIPYRQKTVINSAYFAVESGSDNNGYRWNVVAVNNGSPFQQSLKRIDRYFLPGNYVFIDFVSASGASVSSAFKVISAADATVGDTAKATVVLEPNVTSTTWATYTTQQKAAWRPEGGIILCGTNSISDYESWCNNGAVDNPNNLIFFWLQTSRLTHSVTDEYLKAIEAPNANEFFKVFNILPYGEQLKQQDKRFFEEWWMSIFKGQPINEHQNVNDWQGSGKLPQVVDIDDPSCVLEYKANQLGIEYQLSACSRVTDMAGQPLNFDALTETLYQLKRNREGSNNGETVDVIPLQTDRDTANKIKTVFAAYYKAKYQLTYTQEIGKGPAEKFSQTSGLAVNTYDFDEAGVQLDVVSDPFFHDLLLATPTAHRQASRYAWFLDYSDIDVGIAKSASVTRRFPDPKVIPSDWKCVITPNVKTYQLKSQTYTTAVYRPERHLIVKGFSDACPSLSANGCSVYSG